MHESPNMVYADKRGRVFDHPTLKMVIRSGNVLRAPRRGELIPLPSGSQLMALPGRGALGFAGNEIKLERGSQAVAAFMAPAYTQLGLTAWEREQGASRLPLYAYTAVGWAKGRFYVAGFRSDKDTRQELRGFDQKKVVKNAARRLSESPDNLLLRQLQRCACEYLCPAARNLFLGRWECPLPVSKKCNAACLGCISLQPSGCCPAPMERLSETPSVQDIVEVAVPHLKRAPRPIVSFGQGCEGEPLTEAGLVEKAIREIRNRTPRGTINMNTNASKPDALARLLAAGLDSVRISLNSARQRYYDGYFRPNGYTFSDVVESMRLVKKSGRFLSLNYFILPGFSDQWAELRSLMGLMSKVTPDLIQLRNLNIDPDYYLQAINWEDRGEGVGVKGMMIRIKKKFPGVKFGYFNPTVKG